ncbi:MAG TPA: hypothetical protein V6C82_10890 [Chroococcales cyanobacterium]|jgi:hypothetical protein
MKRELLVLTDDRLGSSMAGPAIRAWEIARQLAPHLEVTLASTQPIGEIGSEQFHVLSILPREREILELAESHRAILAGGLIFSHFPALLRSLKNFLILDLYDPLLLEDLELLKEKKNLGAFIYDDHHFGMERQMMRADYMICASERQKDYWLGRLCALGRLHPRNYREDPSFERLIGCVPFGLPGEPPLQGSPRLRGVIPGIEKNDILFLWGGGIWEWLDPLTPIRAAAELIDGHPEIKLVFLAGRSPNPTTPEMAMSRAAKDLAQELGLLDKNVFFYEHWVPYSERGSFLLEADAGFIAHQNQIETRFSFRTRVLDCLWAGLPILTTEGDAMADLVERKKLGVCCRYRDQGDWKGAFEKMASDESFRRDCRERVLVARADYRWDKSVAPLLERLRSFERPHRGGRPVSWLHLEPWSYLLKAVLSLKEEGVSGFFERVDRFIARRGDA